MLLVSKSHGANHIRLVKQMDTKSPTLEVEVVNWLLMVKTLRRVYILRNLLNGVRYTISIAGISNHFNSQSVHVTTSVDLGK